MRFCEKNIEEKANRMRHVILVATIVTIVGMIAYAQHLAQYESVRIQKRILVTLVWMSMIAVWPFMWRSIIGPHAVSPYSIIGLIWPIAILCLDIVAMRHHTFDNQKHSRRQFMTMDANAICNLTFGIAAFMGVQRVNPSVSRVFLWGILGCVAFIMPSPHSEAEASIDTVAFEAFQKGVLAFSTGILISGVTLVNQSSSSQSSSSSPSSPSSILEPSLIASSLLAMSSSSPSLTSQPSNSEPASLSSDRGSSIKSTPRLSNRRVFDSEFLEELALRLKEELASAGARTTA